MIKIFQYIFDIDKLSGYGRADDIRAGSVILSVIVYMIFICLLATHLIPLFSIYILLSVLIINYFLIAFSRESLEIKQSWLTYLTLLFPGALVVAFMALIFKILKLGLCVLSSGLEMHKLRDFSFGFLLEKYRNFKINRENKKQELRKAKAERMLSPYRNKEMTKCNECGHVR